MRKEKRITIRLTDEEYEKIKNTADLLNLTFSDYLRTATFSKNQDELIKNVIKKQDYYEKIQREISKEINRIGINLNQIARRLNSNQFDEDCKKVFIQLVNEIKKLREELWVILKL